MASGGGGGSDRPVYEPRQLGMLPADGDRPIVA